MDEVFVIESTFSMPIIVECGLIPKSPFVLWSSVGFRNMEKPMESKPY